MNITLRQAALVADKIEQLTALFEDEIIQAMRDTLALAMFAAGISAHDVDSYVIERSK